MKRDISHFIAIPVIFIVLIVVGFFVWFNCKSIIDLSRIVNDNYKFKSDAKNVIDTKNTASQGAYVYKLNNDSCTIKSCMLASQSYPEAVISSFGIARVRGYFKKTIKNSVPFGCENEDKSKECKEYPSVCEEFVITSGADNYYPKQLGFKNPEEVIPINSDGTEYEFFAKDITFKLSQAEKIKLLNSNATNQVEIIIFKYKPEFVGEANPCYADNIILGVN